MHIRSYLRLLATINQSFNHSINQSINQFINRKRVVGFQPGVTNAYVDTDGTLVVVNASTTDARYFICVARNAYGIDQAQLNLVVKGWYIDNLCRQ